MQVYKDGNMLYDSIDNTGTANNASLSARYAKGRLDTIEGNFNNYFDKTEVLDLLAQKVGAEFVDQLPADLTTNVWYYSKKYADGTAVSDDKRALYTKDASDVVQYLGVMGDIDLTDYQENTDDTLTTTNKTIVGAVNEVNGKFDTKLSKDNYNFFFESANADTCVFNFNDCGYTSGELKIQSKRTFMAQITDPISGDRIFGYCETSQYFVSQGYTLHIEQHFTQLQGSNISQRKEFFRKGSIALNTVQDAFSNIVSNASSITWLPWIPIEYPEQIFASTNASVSLTDRSYCITGSLLYINIRNITASSTLSKNSGTEIAQLPANLPYRSHCLGMLYPFTTETANLGGIQIKTDGKLEVFGLTANVRYIGNLVAPLGY